MSRPTLKVDWCSYEAAKYAVINWHYSQRMPSCKLAKLGVWEDGKFIGAVIFGVGASPFLVSNYGLKREEGCELVRVALTNHRTPVSRIMAIALKLIKKAFPKLRLIVSFADPEQGHIGGIYQAGNWLFAGYSAPTLEYVWRGKRYHARIFKDRTGPYYGLDKHPDCEVVKTVGKFRYLMPLDAKMAEKIEPLKQPYPKRVTSIDSDAPVIQAGEGGATPTVTLQNNG